MGDIDSRALFTIAAADGKDENSGLKGVSQGRILGVKMFIPVGLQRL